MDAITKVNSYFPTSTWTSFTVLANLVTNGATECTQAQRIILWVLIALFCVTSHVLSFTDSFELNGTRHTVLLFTGFLVPTRLYRRMMCRGTHEFDPEESAFLEDYEEEIADIESFDPHTVGLTRPLAEVPSSQALSKGSLQQTASSTLQGPSSSRSLLSVPVRDASFARPTRSTSFRGGFAGRKGSFRAPSQASTLHEASLELTPVQQSPEGPLDPSERGGVGFDLGDPAVRSADPVIPLEQGGNVPAAGEGGSVPRKGSDKAWRSRLVARKGKPFIPYTPTSLSTKVVFLPDVPRDPKNPDQYLKFYHYYELGPGQLTIQDFLTAWLTIGTFFTLAVLTHAYVSCAFPSYDPRTVHSIAGAEYVSSPSQGRRLLHVNATLDCACAAPLLEHLPAQFKSFQETQSAAPIVTTAMPTTVDPTVVRTVPTIVAFFVGGLLTLFKTPRQMVGMSGPGIAQPLASNAGATS